jgi:2-amino-4-hydroxy-6-hydroxymethyldihydropteridine diphosphokinase
MSGFKKAVIALGSNLGDRAGQIRAAAEQLSELGGTVLLGLSPLYQSAAVKPDGVDPDAPEYLNAAALIKTDLPPEALLMELAGIEEDFGRVRTERWGDRTLDLDIIWMEDTQMVTENLTIPHPRAHERSFVLIPWLDIQPEARLPGFGPLADMAAGMGNELRVFDPTTQVT